MATREEMIKMIFSIEDDVMGWIVSTIRDYFGKFPGDFVKNVVWYALRQAEDDGRYYNGYNGAYVKDEPCTYWLVGDYVVTYLTDDPDFNAEMLTEEMMDELIIEEV